MDDSRSSSEESDKQELSAEDVGTGRSYECVFCKRGFTTAQALGGHMNIHRRDRAKTKQPICPPHSNPLGLIQPTPIHPTFNFPVTETQKNHEAYFPTSSNEYQHGHHKDELNFQNTRPLSLFEESWRPSVSLRVGLAEIEDNHEEKKRNEEEGELDLELRLGHDP